MPTGRSDLVVPLGTILELVDESMAGIQIRQEVLACRVREGRWSELCDVLDRSLRLVEDMLDELCPATGHERERWARRARSLHEQRDWAGYVMEQLLDELESSSLSEPLGTMRADATTLARPGADA